MSDEPEQPPIPHDPWAPPADKAPVPPPPPAPAPDPLAPPIYSGYPNYPGYPGHPGHPGHPGYGWNDGPQPRNGAGLTGMILGIVGAGLVVTCWGAFLGVPLGIAALILGIVGRRKVKRGEATNAGQALAAVITGAAGAVLSALMVVLLIVLIVQSSNDYGSGDSSSYSDEGYADEDSYDLEYDEIACGQSCAEGLQPGGTATYDDGLQITVSESRRSGDTMRFTVTVHNTGSDTVYLDYNFVDVAFASPGNWELLSGTTTHEDLPDELSPGAASTTGFIVELEDKGADKDTAHLAVEVTPATQYEYAFWELPLS